MVPLHEVNSYLIGMAALQDPVESLADRLVEAANAEDHPAMEWLDHLTREGLSSWLVGQLNAAAAGLRVASYLHFDEESGKFDWVLETPAQRKFRSRDTSYALVFTRIINADLTDRIRRCELDDCRRFFVGDPRSRWCSNTCGSKHRVREKRRRDKR